MLSIKVNAYNKALVFKNNRFVKMLDEGSYWMIPGNRAIAYDMAQPFIPPLDLNILLQDPAVAQALLVIEVKNNEIAILYENGLFKRVLAPGRYAFWKGLARYDYTIIDLDKYEVTEAIDNPCW